MEILTWVQLPPPSTTQIHSGELSEEEWCSLSCHCKRFILQNKLGEELLVRRVTATAFAPKNTTSPRSISVSSPLFLVEENCHVILTLPQLICLCLYFMTPSPTLTLQTLPSHYSLIQAPPTPARTHCQFHSLRPSRDHAEEKATAVKAPLTALESQQDWDHLVTILVADLADLPRLQEVKWLMQTPYLRRTWLSAAALHADYTAERN